MGKRGKRYKKLKSNIKENKIYEIQEAIKQIKSESSVKFDETVENCHRKFIPWWIN